LKIIAFFFSPGLTNLLDTPVMCWNILLLQSQEQESPEQEELRILLCSIHTPSTPGYAAILFSVTSYFSVLWRYILVLHAQGSEMEKHMSVQAMLV
jgi:hypothetical protein